MCPKLNLQLPSADLSQTQPNNMTLLDRQGDRFFLIHFTIQKPIATVTEQTIATWRFLGTENGLAQKLWLPNAPNSCLQPDVSFTVGVPFSGCPFALAA